MVGGREKGGDGRRERKGGIEEKYLQAFLLGVYGGRDYTMLGVLFT